MSSPTTPPQYAQPVRAKVWRIVTLLAVMAGVQAACGAATLSPLATVDQLNLDQRSTRLDKGYSFPVARLEAKAAFRLAHGLPVSAEAEARMAHDIADRVAGYQRRIGYLD